MEFRLHPRAPIILSVWFCLPGALLCPFIFWQSFLWGVAFLVLWVLAALALGVSLGRTMRGTAKAGQLIVCCGLLFKCSWRLPLRYITGLTRLETPLTLLTHCCTLVVHTSGRAVVLPALGDEIATQLTNLLQREAG